MNGWKVRWFQIGDCEDPIGEGKPFMGIGPDGIVMRRNGALKNPFNSDGSFNESYELQVDMLEFKNGKRQIAIPEFVRLIRELVQLAVKEITEEIFVDPQPGTLYGEHVTITVDGKAYLVMSPPTFAARQLNLDGGADG